MTSQIPDLVRVDGADLVVTAVDGAGLFDPEAHGYRPTPLHTACWRGVHCEYAVAGGRLVLTTVRLGRPADGEPPVLLGARPEPSPQPFRGGYSYTGLHAPVAFTGRLLLAADRTASGYLNMGFPPAWRFARVLEAHFAGGLLTATHNRSAEAAAVRDRLGAAGLRPHDGEDTAAWVDRTFSLAFDYSLPGH